MTIMHHRIEQELGSNLRPKTRKRSSINHHIYQIWPYDFFLFLKLKLPLHFESIGFTKIVELDKGLLESPCEMCFVDWKDAGKCVLYQMGLTLKAITKFL